MTITHPLYFALLFGMLSLIGLIYLGKIDINIEFLGNIVKIISK
jgi:hypothetical protein